GIDHPCSIMLLDVGGETSQDAFDIVIGQLGGRVSQERSSSSPLVRMRSSEMLDQRVIGFKATLRKACSVQSAINQQAQEQRNFRQLSQISRALQFREKSICLRLDFLCDFPLFVCGIVVGALYPVSKPYPG